MHNHFDKHLNLKQIILDRKPKVIVECGAGNGDLTRKLSSLLDEYPFDLYVISDYPVDGLDDRIRWINGISYEALKGFGDGTIDLCIIDTDHNYWTLMKELSELFNRMSEGGLIAMHDVETFYHDTGMALKYSNGMAYPQEEIEKFAENGSLGCALVDFLQIKKLNYKLFAYNRESHGAAIIEKRTVAGFTIFSPGDMAVFVK